MAHSVWRPGSLSAVHDHSHSYANHDSLGNAQFPSMKGPSASSTRPASARGQLSRRVKRPAPEEPDALSTCSWPADASVMHLSELAGKLTVRFDRIDGHSTRDHG